MDSIPWVRCASGNVFYIMRIDILACVVNELHFDLSTFPPTVLTLQLLIHFSKSLEYHMKRIATKEKVIC